MSRPSERIRVEPWPEPPLRRGDVLSRFTGIPAVHFAAADSCYSCRLAMVKAYTAGDAPTCPNARRCPSHE